MLDTFDAAHTRRTLTEIAAAADLPLSTTHRLVAELVAWQGLTRGADGSYEIGRRIWDLGALAAVSRELREAALPFMQDLAADHRRERARRGAGRHKALYIDRIAGQRAVPVVSKPAARLPLHATGVGKVLLAYADPEVLRECLGGLTRITRYTVVEPTTPAASTRRGAAARLRDHLRGDDDRRELDRRTHDRCAGPGGRRVGIGHQQPSPRTESAGPRRPARRPRHRPVARAPAGSAQPGR